MIALTKYCNQESSMQIKRSIDGRDRVVGQEYAPEIHDISKPDSQ